MSPAVLTETLWAIGIRDPARWPDRVRILTTTRGREVLCRELFANGAWPSFTAKMEKQAGLAAPAFGDASESIRLFPAPGLQGDLEDIRTREDYLMAADTLLEIVQGLCAAGQGPLMASLAGGRKATSALLYGVMTLAARPTDSLTHVLVSEPWEQFAHFLYPGCGGTFHDPNTGKELDSEKASVELADVPFVPLRERFEQELGRSPGNFSQLVSAITGHLLVDSPPPSLQFDENGQVWVDGQQISLSRNEWLFWLACATRTHRDQTALENLADIEKDMRSLVISLKAGAPDECLAAVDWKEDPRKWASSLRRKLRDAGISREGIERLVPRKQYLAVDLPAQNIKLPPKSSRPLTSLVVT